jgi:hypothetical protein
MLLQFQVHQWVILEGMIVDSAQLLDILVVWLVDSERFYHRQFGVFVLLRVKELKLQFIAIQLNKTLVN